MPWAQPAIAKDEPGKSKRNRKHEHSTFVLVLAAVLETQLREG